MLPHPHNTQISFPKLKYPPFRDEMPNRKDMWLKGKQLHDGAEDLWRIYDDLFDLTDFISEHPGGAQWLLDTKGTDITEQFETHHLKDNLAEAYYLPKYFVRKAKTPRNYPFTFEGDGFYKTLKAKIVAELSQIPKDCRDKSNSISDSLLLCLIITSPICCWLWTKHSIYGAVSTIFVSYILSNVTICAHNYFHRADNWRMYLFNLCGLSYRDWRVSHAMSHHLHTNTAHDIELSMLEPFLHFLPRSDKTVLAQTGALYYPVIYCFTIFYSFAENFITCLLRIGTNKLSWENIIPFLLPTWMWLASGVYLPCTLAVWFAIFMITSFIFTIFGLTAGHHGPDAFFEGDIPSNERLDWGIHQLHAIVENIDNSSNHYKTLTRFGGHYLHHLFPTLDHGELQYLNPIVLKHCEKFETQLRRTTFYKAILNQSKQLIRKTPNDFREYNKIIFN